MAQFRNFHFYPYSGWPEKSWADVSVADGGADVDVFARESRRITESLGAKLLAADIPSRRRDYRAFLRGAGDDNEVRVDLWDLKLTKDLFLANVTLPSDFRSLGSDQRADIILAVARECLLPLAQNEGWVDRLDASVQRVKDDNFACVWHSDWKNSRDKRFRVRMIADIRDDGYGRWKLEIEDNLRAGPTVSDSIFGWTWLLNFQRAAKTMKFSGPNILTVSAAGCGYRTAEINLETGRVRKGEKEPTMFAAPPTIHTIPVPQLSVQPLKH